MGENGRNRWGEGGLPIPRGPVLEGWGRGGVPFPCRHPCPVESPFPRTLPAASPQPPLRRSPAASPAQCHASYGLNGYPQVGLYNPREIGMDFNGVSFRDDCSSTSYQVSSRHLSSLLQHRVSGILELQHLVPSVLWSPLLHDDCSSASPCSMRSLQCLPHSPLVTIAQ